MKMEQDISCSRVIDKFQVDIQHVDMEKFSSATMIFPQAKNRQKNDVRCRLKHTINSKTE